MSPRNLEEVTWFRHSSCLAALLLVNWDTVRLALENFIERYCAHTHFKIIAHSVCILGEILTVPYTTKVPAAHQLHMFPPPKVRFFHSSGPPTATPGFLFDVSKLPAGK
ncbi:hypothetical protein CPB83DRAFT_6765 [Crepidotus variabilis]|uniref:Uncharacterized protein n=1 Tax=Crepidotus variabilis TaxID=179855 RepID=A0A9P6ESL1_9AGAR|nr:hypothetical protein CPB83DRAFT_6765 [Crepidotus variabilis]